MAVEAIQHHCRLACSALAVIAEGRPSAAGAFDRLALGAVLEAPGFVSGLDDPAVMRQSVEESAVVILKSPKITGHSPGAKLVVTMTEVR